MKKVAGAAACLLFASAAAAQTAWPERSVRLIVPFPAGSATDVAMRLIETAMTPRLGHPLVIDNRSGASGAIGVDAVAKAQPDGYTTGLVTVSTHAVAPALGKKLPYDPLADMTPVGMVGSTPYVLVAYPGLGVGNLKELLALAKDVVKIERETPEEEDIDRGKAALTELLSRDLTRVGGRC